MAQPLHTPPKLLIVDDEESIRDTMALLFELDGFEVKTAENGDKAFAIAQSEPIDIVVTDIRMPVCDGMELLERLKGLGNAMPAVFLISGDATQSSQECIRRGAKGMFRKPFTHGDLTKAIKDLH